MIKIKIKLPERRIDLNNSEEVVDYLVKHSFIRDCIGLIEVESLDKLSMNLIIDLQMMKIPVRIVQKNSILHFETTVTSLSQTQAMLLQINMWNKPVETNLVYPYAMCNEAGEVAFTVSGGLPLTRIKSSQLSNFLSEFVSTCGFVLQCNFDFGKDGPPGKADLKPDWLEKATKEELNGPRSSEFILDNKPPNLAQEDSQDDHSNQ